MTSTLLTYMDGFQTAVFGLVRGDRKQRQGHKTVGKKRLVPAKINQKPQQQLPVRK